MRGDDVRLQFSSARNPFFSISHNYGRLLINSWHPNYTRSRVPLPRYTSYTIMIRVWVWWNDPRNIRKCTIIYGRRRWRTVTTVWYMLYDITYGLCSGVSQSRRPM